MALVGGALASPIAARAQQPSVPVIGFLSPLEAYPPSLNEFHNGLAESGYHEGRNVLIEYRWGKDIMIDCPPWRPTWFGAG
jgi:putative tryptophan/tyrosine transport system substrate-binding protein